MSKRISEREIGMFGENGNRRNRWLLLGLAGALLCALSGTSQADSISYDFIYFNVPGYPSPYGTLTVDRTSATTAKITISGDTVGKYAYLIIPGNVAVGLEVNSSDPLNLKVTGLVGSNSYNPPGGFTLDPLTYSTSSGGKNVSAWGDFNLTIDKASGPGGAPAAMTQIAFSLCDPSANWLSAGSVLKKDGSGFLAADHIAVFDASDVAKGSTVFVTGYAAVPLPSSLAGGLVLLTGLGVVAAMRRRERILSFC